MDTMVFFCGKTVSELSVNNEDKNGIFIMQLDRNGVNFIILYINVTGKREELYEEKVYCMADGSGYDIDREQCINGNDICTN